MSLDRREGRVPEVEDSWSELGAGGVWRELCARCNELRLVPESWWARIAADPEAVFCVEESAVRVRLRGSVLAEVELRGTGLQCRIAPEHLLLSHPGARAVLGDAGAAAEPGRVASLADLAVHYDHVRRRVCMGQDQRSTVIDRLFLRHSCILIVDAPLPSGRADLVALSPGGDVVFYLLRRYCDPLLRLKGRGGIVWRMQELSGCLADDEAMTLWVQRLLERSRLLETPHSRRFRFAGRPRVHPRARLLIVDFDHAQRQHGLPSLRANLEDGLDHSAARGDIHCIGDAGNISYGTFFSGI
jgi:hypothetical protein